MSDEPTGTIVSRKFTRIKEVPQALAQVATFSIGPRDLENPSLLTKAKRLRHELGIWAKAGLPVAPKALRKARLAVCAACEYYDPAGNWGMGQCKAPGCGCSRVKAALLTSVCPKNKWPRPEGAAPKAGSP